MKKPAASTRRHEATQTPEELVMGMTVAEIQELLSDMGFEPTAELAAGIKQLVRDTGSLDAAIVALHDDRVTRRAA